MLDSEWANLEISQNEVNKKSVNNYICRYLSDFFNVVIIRNIIKITNSTYIILFMST